MEIKSVAVLLLVLLSIGFISAYQTPIHYNLDSGDFDVYRKTQIYDNDYYNWDKGNWEKKDYKWKAKAKEYHEKDFDYTRYSKRDKSVRAIKNYKYKND